MGMSEAEKKQLIAQLLKQGYKLGEIQKILEKEHQIRMSYMELRILSSELEVDWSKIETPRASTSSVKPEVINPEPEGTVVTVSKVVRPGAVMSGEVKFRSGKKAEWFLDQMGRIGLAPKEGNGQPSQEELMEFQKELQNVIRKKMGGPT